MFCVLSPIASARKTSENRNRSTRGISVFFFFGFFGADFRVLPKTPKGVKVGWFYFLANFQNSRF